MTQEMKALAVIEGSLLIDEPEDKRLGFIYRMAHTGRGECEHKEWIDELEKAYQQLVKENIINPIPEQIKLQQAEVTLHDINPDMCAKDCVGDICEGCKEFIPIVPEQTDKLREAVLQRIKAFVLNLEYVTRKLDNAGEVTEKECGELTDKILSLTEPKVLSEVSNDVRHAIHFLMNRHYSTAMTYLVKINEAISQATIKREK